MTIRARADIRRHIHNRKSDPSATFPKTFSKHFQFQFQCHKLSPRGGEGTEAGAIEWETFSAVDENVFYSCCCCCCCIWYFVVVFCLCVNLSSLIGALFLLIQAINKHSLWHATYITDILAFDLLFIIRTRKRKVENPREISLWVRTMFASHRISVSDRIGSDRARLTCKTSFHFEHFIFVFVFVSVSLYHSFFVHFVVALDIAVRCF